MNSYYRNQMLKIYKKIFSEIILRFLVKQMFLKTIFLSTIFFFTIFEEIKKLLNILFHSHRNVGLIGSSNMLIKSN